MAAGASGALAKQYVEFISKGLDELQAGLNSIRTNLASVDAASKAVVDGTTSKFSGLASAAKGSFGAWAATAIAKVGEVTASISNGLKNALASAASTLNQGLVSPVAIGAAVAGFAMVTNAAKSWVSAGLSGTTHGNMLSMQFQLLSQQIAGIFVPTINMVIRGIETMVRWFRDLTGEQQGNIRRWIEAAAAMVAVYGALTKVSGIIAPFITTIITGMVSAAGAIVSTLIPAFGAFVTAVVTGSGIAGAALNLAFVGIPILIGMIGAIVSALGSLTVAGITVGAGLAVGTQTGRAALEQLWNQLRPVVAAFVNMGSTLWNTIGPVVEFLGGRVGALFQRLAGVLTGLAQAGGPILQRIADLAADVGEWLGAMLDGIDFSTLKTLGEGLAGIFSQVAPYIVQIVQLVMNVADWIIKAGGLIADWFVQFGGVKIALGLIAAAVSFLVGVVVQIGVVIAASFAMAIAAAAPFLAITGAIVAAIGGIAYVTVRVVQAFWPVIEAIGTILSALWQVAGIIVGPILSAFGSLLDLRDGLGGISETFETWMVTIREVAEYIAHTLIQSFRALMVVLSEVMDRMAQMVESMPAALQRLAGMAGVTSESIRRMAAELRTAASGIGTAGAAGAAGAPRRPGAAGGNDRRTDVEQAGGRFEAAMDLFRRLNETAVKSQHAERTAAATERTAAAAERLANEGWGGYDADFDPVYPPGWGGGDADEEAA